MIPPPGTSSDTAHGMGLCVPSILQAHPHRLLSPGLVVSLVAQLLKAGSEVSCSVSSCLSLICPLWSQGTTLPA